MDEWICTKDVGIDGFTAGKVYKVNHKGLLIDDDGDVRLTPSDYNGCFMANIFVMIPPVSLVNE